MISFIIDYHDHYASADPRISRFNFYGYGERMWRLFNPSNHYQNRLRHSDYERLFAESGLVMKENRRVVPADSPRDFPGIAKRFRAYDAADLAALNGFFTLTSAGHSQT